MMNLDFVHREQTILWLLDSIESVDEGVAGIRGPVAYQAEGHRGSVAIGRAFSAVLCQ